MAREIKGTLTLKVLQYVGQPNNGCNVTAYGCSAAVVVFAATADSGRSQSTAAV